MKPDDVHSFLIYVLFGWNFCLTVLIIALLRRVYLRSHTLFLAYGTIPVPGYKGSPSIFPTWWTYDKDLGYVPKAK